ncbi:hypothetical protein AwPolaro_02820 [Polaromonas sp.]|nr:hypothetical protein AwPolaro_02820 [Polaromonas sp.]
MQTDAYHLWCARIVTFSLSALAAASAGYWVLKGWPRAIQSAVPVVATQAVPQGSQTLARMLGGGASNATPVDALKHSVTIRYTLMGVVDSQDRSAALISIDGQAAKPIRVGQAVDATLLLQSVTARRAVLVDSLSAAAGMTLELPLPGP